MDDHQTQELEIEALKAIYSDDFKEAPPPKVWKVCHFTWIYDKTRRATVIVSAMLVAQRG
jgi:hypothetical protein